MFQRHARAFRHAELRFVGDAGLDSVRRKTSSDIFLKSDEPPVSVIPLSIMSAASSGEVSCKTSLMALVIS